MNRQTTSNNGMHPTADTLPFIFGYLVGRRVMPGVSLLPITERGVLL